MMALGGWNVAGIAASIILVVAAIAFLLFGIYEVEIKQVSAEVCQKRMRLAIRILMAGVPAWVVLVLTASYFTWCR